MANKIIDQVKALYRQLKIIKIMETIEKRTDRVPETPESAVQFHSIIRNYQAGPAIGSAGLKRFRVR